ncbi:MAG: hypothetical protein KC766_12180 [Myxococcales bacterium]|nr:hypothetical protein [Myxococcales bacterium]
MLRGPIGVALLALGYAACGPAASPNKCMYEGWAGQCQLKGLIKVREMESFPRAFAVFEVTYEPLDTESPLSPPASRFEVMAPADNEGQLEAHFQQYATAACRIDPSSLEACKEGKLQVQVPAFTPTQVAPDAPQQLGCKQLEARGQVNPDFNAGQVLEVEFSFDADSGAPGPDATAKAQQLASLIKSKPGWECIAITGFITFGESLSLAETRARAIKKLLLDQGVDASRFVTFAASIGTAAAEDRVARPEERRVKLKVLIEKK